MPYGQNRSENLVWAKVKSNEMGLIFAKSFIKVATND